MEKLNESIEKSFIREEKRLTDEHNRTAMQQDSDMTPDSTPLKGAQRFLAVGVARKKRSGVGGQRSIRPQKLDWSSATAADIEEGAVKETAAAEAKKSVSRTNIRRPKRKPFSTNKTRASGEVRAFNPKKRRGKFNFS